MADFKGSLLYLQPLVLDDAAALLPITTTQANIRLFAQTYEGRRCEDLSHLRYVLITHLHDPSLYGEAFAIKSQATNTTIGWVTMKVSGDGESLATCAMFLPAGQRTRHVVEMIFILARRFFQDAECQTIEYRTGTLSDCRGHSAGLNSAITMDGILRRQFLVDEPNRVSDLARVQKAHWPAIKPALEAWLGLGDDAAVSPEEDH